MYGMSRNDCYANCRQFLCLRSARKREKEREKPYEIVHDYISYCVIESLVDREAILISDPGNTYKHRLHSTPCEQHIGNTPNLELYQTYSRRYGSV